MVMIKYSLHPRLERPDQVAMAHPEITGVPRLPTPKSEQGSNPDSNHCPHLSPPKSKNEHPFEPNVPTKIRRSSLPSTAIKRAQEREIQYSWNPRNPTHVTNNIGLQSRETDIARTSQSLGGRKLAKHAVAFFLPKNRYRIGK
jgi:hypothetical protein